LLWDLYVFPSLPIGSIYRDGHSVLVDRVHGRPWDHDQRPPLRRHARRLYEREQDRRKYIFFTLYVTLAVAALFVIATHNIWLASALITAYVTWSPWHFSTQNYGLLLMFMRREGVDFDDTTKRLFYASFIFATAMSIEGVQAASSELVFAPATFSVPGTPQVFQLAFLQEYAVPILWTLGVLYAGSLGAALVRLRGSGFRLVGPATLMILTQAFFTSVPVVAGRIYTKGEINLAFAPVWISMAHSAQYLWVSAYFAKRSDAQQGSARFLGKSFLAGLGHPNTSCAALCSGDTRQYAMGRGARRARLFEGESSSLHYGRRNLEAARRARQQHPLAFGRRVQRIEPNTERKHREVGSQDHLVCMRALGPGSRPSSLRDRGPHAQRQVK
jgi:hypothetical protein